MKTYNTLDQIVMKTQKEIPLPRYTIEHVNGRWELYDTQTCETVQFETKLEAENFLKELKL